MLKKKYNGPQSDLMDRLVDLIAILHGERIDLVKPELAKCIFILEKRVKHKEITQYLQSWSDALCGDTKFDRMRMLTEMWDLLEYLGVEEIQ